VGCQEFSGAVDAERCRENQLGWPGHISEFGTVSTSDDGAESDYSDFFDEGSVLDYDLDDIRSDQDGEDALEALYPDPDTVGKT
jgi:hypothetical protein